MRLVLLSTLAGLALAQSITPVVPPPPGQIESLHDENAPTFGVAVYITDSRALSGGLTGQVYKLKPNSDEVPNFKKMKPIATVYTQSLAIPARDFTEGFPGVPDVFEWFAIEYTGKFWIEDPGEYRFLLTSDDGSRLYIDGKKVVDNNGVHAPELRDGKAKLKRGVHEMLVQYFQGPRYHVALILEVLPPDGRRRVFSTKEFKLPPDALDNAAVQPK
jgi:hypothetical protein